MKTTVTKWGNSQGVRIPRDILDDVNIAAGDSVEVLTEDGVIIIRKERGEKNIQELFAGYDGTYVSEEINWGIPVGDEEW